MNKLTTQSYFVKRLKDSGYEVWKVFDAYSESDSRHWSIVIDPGVASVFCTCYVDDENWERSYFEISDGNQFIPRGYKIDTDSIEVFITHLVKFGINNKRTETRVSTSNDRSIKKEISETGE